MVQTVLFNNTNDNESLKQPNLKTQPSFERSSTINQPLNSNSNNKLVLDDIKREENNIDKTFDFILLDLKNTDMNEIKCVKKNMYIEEQEEDLKYIAISYHHNGELKEQLFKTPNHTAHITSIDLKHLDVLLYYIKNETDLKNIRYVWLDAISLDQQQQQQQENQISYLFKRSEIYNRATYILAVPDLNRGYLKQNPANRIVFSLIKKYRSIIYEELRDHHQDKDNKNHHHHPFSVMKNQLKKLKGKNDIKKIYQFLAYLLYEWSNNPLVINEYHIAKVNGTPFKYMFISLLIGTPIIEANTFFSYNFDYNQQQQQKHLIYKYTNNRNYSRVDYLKKIINDLNFKFIQQQQYKIKNQHQQQQNKINNNLNNYLQVDNHKKLIHFLNIRLTQRHYLDMILNAYITNNNNNSNNNLVKLYGILSTLEKYQYLIQNNNKNDNDDQQNNNNSIANWEITDTTSVRLKLYEIMDNKNKENDDDDNDNDDDDLWDKAGLLYACSQSKHKAVLLPSFATYDSGDVYIPEKYHIEMAHKIYLDILSNYEMKINNNTKNVKHYLKEYKVEVGNLYTKNLISIQSNHNHNYNNDDDHYSQPYLSVKSNVYFISKLDCKLFDKHFLSSCSLNDDHHLRLVFIPYFVFNIPDYVDVPPLDGGSGVYLLGNMHQNRWVVININLYTDYLAPYLPYSQDYTFDIY